MYQLKNRFASSNLYDLNNQIIIITQWIPFQHTVLKTLLCNLKKQKCCYGNGLEF